MSKDRLAREKSPLLIWGFAASPWNVPDSIGMARDIPELDLKVLVWLTMSTLR